MTAPYIKVHLNEKVHKNGLFHLNGKLEGAVIEEVYIFLKN